MADTNEEILIKLTKHLENELDTLKERLEKGGKLIDAEFSESKRSKLLEKWGELDKVYKRVLLAHSVLSSTKEGPARGVYCAVCLGLVKPEQLLESGWDMPEDDSN